MQPMQQGVFPYPMQGNTVFNLNQSLAILESEVFGRTFNGTHVGIRLNNLEQQVFGRTYPQYSFEQRVNRLMRRSTHRQSNSRRSPLKSLAGEALNMFMYNQMYNSGTVPYGYTDPLYGQPAQLGW